MLKYLIHERQSRLLQIMMGAVLFRDAGPSLGMQDQCKRGNKVRVLLSGPATLLVMAIYQIPHSRKRSSASLCFSRPAKCQPQTGEAGIEHSYSLLERAP